MGIKDIVKDVIIYPFSVLKRFLILGILVIIGNIVNLQAFSILGITNVAIIWIFWIIWVLIGLFIWGYLFRVIKTSLTGNSELPEFKSWLRMFIDGIKIAIVGIVYLIPAFLIILFITGLKLLFLPPMAGNISSYPSVLLLGEQGIGGVTAFLYVIVILPILAVSISNMGYKNGEFKAAFRFHEILDRIRNIGENNLIKWYIVSGILFLIIAILGLILINIFSIFIPHIIMQVLIPLILIPYLELYLARSIALIYLTSIQIKYLQCEKCGGYYELQEGESPEDFEKCQCGGKLRTHNHSQDSKNSLSGHLNTRRQIMNYFKMK